MQREQATEKYELPHAFELALAEPRLGLVQCRCGQSIAARIHAVEALSRPEVASAGYEGFVTEKGV